MIDYGTIFSVLVGGVIALLGTLLANYLQYRSEQRRLRRERIEERIAEVRRYLVSCLEFADFTSIPTRAKQLGDVFGLSQFEEWNKLASDLIANIHSLPARGSARVLFIEDKEVLQLLERFDMLKLTFFFYYRSFIRDREIEPLEDEREELKELAAEIGSRLDRLLDEI
jgi:hypothetical protein